MKRILVADDEMAIRHSYSEELRGEGYEVFTAANGREAILAAGKILVDLVIMDIKMPEMDGLEALRILKEFIPTLPVIISSAYSEYKQDFSTWAAEDYFVKSSDLIDLKMAVERTIREV
jgi:two-component system response regulator (stage 0 sporulation protein F)